MTAKQKYLELERNLFIIRKKNDNVDSQEEDNLLDEMDVIWEEMTEQEQKEVNEINNVGA